MCSKCEIGKKKGTFETLGRSFGYPQCCIDEFIKHVAIIVLQDIDPRTDEQNFIGTYTHGFIPCAACTEKVVTGQITLNSLIRDRDSKNGKFNFTLPAKMIRS